MIGGNVVAGFVDAVKEAPCGEEIDIKEEVIPPFSLDQKASNYISFKYIEISVYLIINCLLMSQMSTTCFKTPIFAVLWGQHLKAPCAKLLLLPLYLIVNTHSLFW